MAQDNNSENTGAAPPVSLAQVPPKITRSYDEMNTGQMVFEMQGTIGELKEAVANLTNVIQSSNRRIEQVEKTSDDIKEILKALTPKIDDLVGFSKHAAPNFATKADIASLNHEIGRRPTRWQSLVNMGVLVALVAALLTIGSKLAH